METKPMITHAFDKDYSSNNEVKARETLDTMLRMIGKADPAFGEAINRTDFVSGFEPLAMYFDSVSQEVGKEIRAVTLMLNNWAKKLGIGLMSATIRPLATRDLRRLNTKKPISMLPKSELKYPTVGVMPHFNGEPCVTVGFKVDQGGEKLTSMSEDLLVTNVREGILAQKRNPVFHSLSTGLSLGSSHLVTHPGLVAVHTHILDKSKFDASCLEHGKVDNNSDSLQQVYLCQYLTEGAVFDAVESI